MDFVRIAFLLLALVTSARAWDSGAHEVIATMAYDQMNPKARQAVAELAREMTNPDGQPYDSITIACWMDDLRRDSVMPDRGRFLSWHYIDIGLEGGDPAPSFEPGDDTDMHGNVVQALKRAMVVLRGGGDPYVTSKAMACAMVMHLVGDIQQPLHCATKYFYSYGKERSDAGGNKEFVINGPPGDSKFNLHAFWDSAWRATFDTTSGLVMLDEAFARDAVHDPRQLRAMADALEKMPQPAGADLGANFDQWARESNGIARDFVYRELTATDSKKYCRLSSEYVAKGNEIARERLVLAARRLAALMNATLGS